MGFTWVNPLIADIYGIRVYSIPVGLRPFPIREAESFTLQVDFIGADPSHRPSLHLQIGPEKPALPESLAVPWAVHMASARIYHHGHGLIWEHSDKLEKPWGKLRFPSFSLYRGMDRTNHG